MKATQTDPLLDAVFKMLWESEQRLTQPLPPPPTDAKPLASQTTME